MSKHRPPSKVTAPSGANVRGRNKRTATDPEQKARVAAHAERVAADLKRLSTPREHAREKARIEAAIDDLEREDRSLLDELMRPGVVRSRVEERAAKVRAVFPKVTKRQLDRVGKEHARDVAARNAQRSRIGDEVRALLRGEAS